MFHKQTLKYSFFLFIPFIFCVFTGCFDSKNQAKQPHALKVQTQTIAPHNVSLNFEYPARLKSVQNVNVYARVQGILLAKHFKEGDIVQEGQPLFTIEPVRYQAKADQARAQYQSAQASFVKANRDWQRVEKLYKQGVYTIDQYDTSRANYLQAQANVASTKAALDDAEIDLGYTNVVASASGRTGLRGYDVGNLVGTSGSTTVLTTITQLTPIYAEFAIPNTDYYFMRGLENGSIQVAFVFGNGEVYEKLGKLDFVDSMLDSQTSTVKARAIVENEEYKMLPNEFVRVQLKGFEAQNAITIPQSALMQDNEGSYVFVLKDGKAKIARVILSQNLRNNEALIASGLQGGDILVLNQLSKVREGMPLEVASTSKSNDAKPSENTSAQ